MGSGENGQLTFIDVLSIASFLVGLENLDLNITQEDVQNLESDFNKRLEALVKDIHGHLSVQDEKLNYIIHMLERN